MINNNAKKYLDYYFAIRYRDSNRGKNGHDEELAFLFTNGGRTADALMGRRFFASALTNPADYFGGLHGGSSDPPVRLSGNANPCGPSFFWACLKDCAL